MRINSIKINNFRCYYGENTLNLNNDGKITLIYGDSGYGKSSFLQFFNWILFDKPNFGPNDDRPIFNEAAYFETKLGELFPVEGVIDFEHLGLRYNLRKVLKFKAGVTINSTRVESRDFVLTTLENDTWVSYKGDINNKINSIIPVGLSNYFLLDGEKARDIVLDSINLKKAIHSLFGLDAYEKAIDHLGHDNKKRSVIGRFTDEMTSQMRTTTSNNMTAAELQDTLNNLSEDLENNKHNRDSVKDDINLKNARRDEILKILGEGANRNNLTQIIKSNESWIKEYEKKIRGAKHKIGDLFYKNYPYLFMSKNISQSAAVLREKNLTFAKNYHNIFENLKKNLLQEILEKDVCVCGRPLDENSINHINDIINVMPPDSYTYQFGQFVAKSKKSIRDSKQNVFEYDKFLDYISSCQEKIGKYEADSHEKIEALKRLDAAKTLVDELEQIKDELKSLEREKSKYEGNIARQKQTFQISSRLLSDLKRNDKISLEYNDKINFFKLIAATLVAEKKDRENRVKVVLNNCVRDIFKRLTTQKELDADKIQFINDDFSLRTTYLTGGQLAVDEYSYVIGIVKALQEFNMNNNENPIIIDAPFAFTGNRQSEHIFTTLPSVVKQTILLTLDLNKIKRLLNRTDLYEFYVIKNDSQTKAYIERGDINDIKF